MLVLSLLVVADLDLQMHSKGIPNRKIYQEAFMQLVMIGWNLGVMLTFKAGGH